MQKNIKGIKMLKQIYFLLLLDFVSLFWRLFEITEIERGD